jgi:hypothetical protein
MCIAHSLCGASDADINARGGILSPYTDSAEWRRNIGKLCRPLGTISREAASRVRCVEEPKSDESELLAESGVIRSNASGKPPIRDETRDSARGSCTDAAIAHIGRNFRH